MGAIQDTLDKFGNDTVDIIRRNLASTGTNASGETSRSLESKSRPLGVTVSGKAFIYVVETGRRAGKMPPISAIMKWLQTGKVEITGSIESAAWAISKKIAAEGSSLFRKGGREDIITPAVSDERIDQLTSDLADVILNETANTIEDGTKR